VDFVDVQSVDDVSFAKQKLIEAIAQNQPLQINVCFDLPLSSTSKASEFLETIEIPKTTPTVTEIDCNSHGVVIAGAGGDAARKFAEAANWPLFAEPSSGARGGSQVITHYAELLSTPLAEKIQKVVVFGKPTLNRSVVNLISNQHEITVVGSRYGNFDIADNAKQFEAVTAIGSADAAWLAEWKTEAKSANDSRQQLITKIWEKTSIEDNVYLGASKMIRVADTVAPPKDIKVFSNRGLAGIDGSVSTAIGIAMNTSGITRAIIGDLTAIHDLGGMNLSGLDVKNLQLWVVNDHGGKIFEQLEVKQEVSVEVFDKYFQTPQQVSFEKISSAMGWNYELIESEQDIDHGVDLEGPVLVEFRP
jgi:2-succinyl-5-enolpyruvyl-6-hydroxy-3-cyclohexene-1-carboxylate synthase